MPGVIPISFTQDRVGPHARSVADAALLLTYIRGFDPEDLATSESLGRAESKPLTEFLDSGGLAGARLGILRDLFRRGEPFAKVNETIEQEIAMMRQHRAVAIDGLTTGIDLIDFFSVARTNIYELRFASTHISNAAARTVR